MPRILSGNTLIYPASTAGDGGGGGGGTHIGVTNTVARLAAEYWQLLNYSNNRSTSQPVANRAYLYPFSLSNDAILDEFALDIATAGGADQDAKFALYEISPDTGYGAARVAASEYAGAADWVSTGVKKMTFGSQYALEKGKAYLIGCCFSTGTPRPYLRYASPSTPDYYGNAFTLPVIPYAAANFNATAYARGYFKDTTYANAFPNPLDTGYDLGAIQYWMFGLRLLA